MTYIPPTQRLQQQVAVEDVVALKPLPSDYMAVFGEAKRSGGEAKRSGAERNGVGELGGQERSGDDGSSKPSLPSLEDVIVPKKEEGTHSNDSLCASSQGGIIDNNDNNRCVDCEILTAAHMHYFGNDRILKCHVHYNR